MKSQARDTTNRFDSLSLRIAFADLRKRRNLSEAVDDSAAPAFASARTSRLKLICNRFSSPRKGRSKNSRTPRAHEGDAKEPPTMRNSPGGSEMSPPGPSRRLAHAFQREIGMRRRVDSTAALQLPVFYSALAHDGEAMHAVFFKSAGFVAFVLGRHGDFGQHCGSFCYALARVCLCRNCVSDHARDRNSETRHLASWDPAGGGTDAGRKFRKHCESQETG
jgi:hypothetical protein